MTNETLEQLLGTVIDTGKEMFTLYRLGIFNGKAYELVDLDANKEYPNHLHHNSSSELHCVHGEGIITIDGNEFPYSSGNSFSINRGQSHGFRTDTRTLFLSINTPPIIDPLTGDVDIEYS